MTNFSSTPMGREVEKAKTFASNLMLMHAAYSAALELVPIPEDVVSWKRIAELNPELLLTLKAIDLIQSDREISC